MQQEKNVRQLVLEMLLAVTKKEGGEYSHKVIRDVQNKYNYFSTQEKAFMKRLFEGTLERMIELDYCIDCYSKVKTGKMKPVIRNILRMGTYQILYMDSVPDSAACNEAVKLAQAKGFGTLKGFVNGVLRSIARNKEAIPPSDKLSVRYSMPEWIVELWTKQLGEAVTLKVLQGLLQERPVTIRLRTQDKKALEALQNDLNRQGGTLRQHPYLPYAYMIERTDDLTQLSGFAEGAFVIQDVSSMLAVEALGLRKMAKQQPLKILDICAAPGGKSMLAADLLSEAGIEYTLEARDISEYKVELMQENFDRCGLAHVKATAWDALEPDESWLGAADVVIADISCSGLGVIGRKRDIKYKMTPEAVSDIVKLQEQILKVAASYVRPDGRLLFSTCTVNRAENEAHVKWIEDTLKLTPLSLNDTLPEALHTETTKQGYLQLLPGLHDADGFFISTFIRKA